MTKLFSVCVLLLVLAGLSSADDSVLSFKPLVNEISLYKNFLDDGDDAGQTLQIVSINSIKIYTEFSFEFTADFNRKLTPGKDHDYYMEFGLIKPVWKKVSANYQRIYGTFVDKPINQIGLRYSF